MGGGVSASDEMIQLALDVRQHAGSANAEQIGLGPFHPQLFLHQDQPQQSVLRCADAASRLEAYFVSRSGERERRVKEDDTESQVGDKCDVAYIRLVNKY